MDTLKFCPKCENLLSLDTKTNDLLRICRTCNYSEKDNQGGLVMETYVQQRASEAFKILVNEFTPADPTLPRITKLPCPNQQCPTNTRGEPRDVLYQEYDKPHKKYIYICLKCNAEWRTRS